VVAEHTPALVATFALPERLMSDWPIAGPRYADVYDDPEGAWHRSRRTGIRGRAAEFRRPVCGSRRRPLREKVAALGTRGVLLAYWGTTSVLSRWFEKPQVGVDESVRRKA
ncbi:acyl-CoA oxidase, partial [Streptomyces sp. SID7982]|nr:acyl-CoA oxidase [Streptomyces sp. SID7982]